MSCDPSWLPWSALSLLHQAVGPWPLQALPRATAAAPPLPPAVIGRNFHTKVNANFGNSAITSSIEEVRPAARRHGLPFALPAMQCREQPACAPRPKRFTFQGVQRRGVCRVFLLVLHQATGFHKGICWPKCGPWCPRLQEVEKLQWSTIWGADTVMDLRQALRRGAGRRGPRCCPAAACLPFAQPDGTAAEAAAAWDWWRASPSACPAPVLLRRMGSSCSVGDAALHQRWHPFGPGAAAAGAGCLADRLHRRVHMVNRRTMHGMGTQPCTRPRVCMRNCRLPAAARAPTSTRRGSG